MDRRAFIAGMTGSLLAAPPAAEAQAVRVYRVGILFQSSDDTHLRVYLPAFVHALRELAYVEGQNLAIEFRSAEGHAERLPQLAAELVGLHLDVIVSAGTAATRAAKSATAALPIVMVGPGDPVRLGFVSSLARPGRGDCTSRTRRPAPST